MQQIVDQLAAVRDMLDTADRDPLSQRQIGHILVALSTLTDVIEQLAANQRQAQAAIDEVRNS